MADPLQRSSDIHDSIRAATLAGGGSTAGSGGTADLTQYVHISTARTITAQHSFAPSTAQAPFALGANAQGQLVTGLYAEHVSKAITAGNGLTGGGSLGSGSGVTLNVGAGNGISVAADAVAVDLTYAFTWTGIHTFQNNTVARLMRPEATDTYDLGTSVYLWDEIYASQLNAIVFAEMTAQLLGGWLIIPKDAGGLAAGVASGDSNVDFGKAMTVGHFVLIRAHDTGGTIKAEYMQVGTLVSGTRYNVTRDLAGSHVTDPAWTAGTAFMVLGTSGDGRIELNAYDTPRIQVLSQGVTYGALTERVRIGDLNGWGPISSEAYGWGVGDYAGGEYAYYTPSTGLVVRGTLRADDGYLGTLSIDGVLSLGSSGGVYQGTGTFASPTTGLKIWNDSGVGRIGGYNGGALQWYANSDGKLYAGAGNVVLDANGISIIAAATPTRVNSISWMNGVNEVFTIASDTGGSAVINAGSMVTLSGGGSIGLMVGAGYVEIYGYIGASITVSVAACNSAAFTHNSTGNWLAITFDSTRYDDRPAAYSEQHSVSTNISRLTCRIAGVYIISGSAGFAANATGTRGLGVRLNEGTYLAIVQVPNAGSGSGTDLTITTQCKLAVNHCVELMAYQNSGGNLNIVLYGAHSPEFRMVRVP